MFNMTNLLDSTLANTTNCVKEIVKCIIPIGHKTIFCLLVFRFSAGKNLGGERQ